MARLPNDQALLQLQAYLREHTFDELEQEHHIFAKSDDKLVILDYDQINIDWGTTLFGWICRGLILRAGTFELVSFPLAKFHNHGETHADQLKISSTSIFEKVDGSMVQRFFIPEENRWGYATRFQLPSGLADHDVNGFPITWEALIQKAFANFNEEQPAHECWVFELCSPYNKVVVQHTSIFIKLLARRDLKTLKEISVKGHPLAPAHYEFSDPEQIKQFANTFPATTQEGFIVFDHAINPGEHDFRRNKIKSDDYVRLHRIRDGLSALKNLILFSRGKDCEEVLVHFPEYRDDVQLIQKTIGEFCIVHNRAYEDHRFLGTQKDFAMAVNGGAVECPDALFKMRAGKCANAEAYLESLTPTQFVRIFKPRMQAILGQKYQDEL